MYKMCVRKKGDRLPVGVHHVLEEGVGQLPGHVAQAPPQLLTVQTHEGEVLQRRDLLGLFHVSGQKQTIVKTDISHKKFTRTTIAWAFFSPKAPLCWVAIEILFRKNSAE